MKTKKTRARLYYQMFIDVAGLYRWRLKSRNGKIVAESGQGYSSKRGAIRGINITRSSVSCTAVIFVERYKIQPQYGSDIRLPEGLAGAYGYKEALRLVKDWNRVHATEFTHELQVVPIW